MLCRGAIDVSVRQAVQPLFFFLAEQIDLAGQQAEEEPALRMAYCDVNENCCSPQAVYGLIKVLQQQYSGSGTEGGPKRRYSSASGSASKQRFSSNGGIATAGQGGDLWQALQQVRRA